MNLWNFLVNRLRFLVSLQSPELSSIDSGTAVLVLSAKLLVFFSTVSISFSLIISSSCSLSFPNNVAVASVVKSLVSKIFVTLGYQLLSKHFRILILNCSLSNYFPSPIRWLTMCVNLFWTSAIVSPSCILNNSYSWINSCFRALFTSVVPSCVTSRMSHISLGEIHCDTLKNSSRFNTEVIMLLATQSYCIFFATCTKSTTCIGMNGPFTMAFQIPRSIDSMKIFILTFQNW